MTSTPLSSLLRNTGIVSCAALLLSFLMIGQVTAHASPLFPDYNMDVMDLNDTMMNGMLIGTNTIDMSGTTQYVRTLFICNSSLTDGTIYLLGTEDDNYAGMICCHNSDFPVDPTSADISHVNISAQISGSGILLVSTNCSTTLSGNTNQPANDFRGATMIDTAELILTNGATLGDASNQLLLTNGARLDLGGSIQIIKGLLMSSNATIVNGTIIDQAKGNTMVTYPAAN